MTHIPYSSTQTQKRARSMTIEPEKRPAGPSQKHPPGGATTPAGDANSTNATNYFVTLLNDERVSREIQASAFFALGDTYLSSSQEDPVPIAADPIGDATIAGAMPKSAFTANAQAKVCAAAVVKMLANQEPTAPKLINTCYSLVAPDYGISVAGVYRPVNNVLTEVEGSGGVSPADAPKEFRASEAVYAEAWFRTIASEVWG